MNAINNNFKATGATGAKETQKLQPLAQKLVEAAGGVPNAVAEVAKVPFQQQKGVGENLNRVA